MQNTLPQQEAICHSHCMFKIQRTILLELGRECQTDLCPFSSFLIIFSLSLPFPTKGQHSFQKAGSKEGITVQVISRTKCMEGVSTGLGFPEQTPCHGLHSLDVANDASCLLLASPAYSWVLFMLQGQRLGREIRKVHIQTSHPQTFL